MKIPMVDLKGQYQNIKTEIDSAIMEVVESAHFIKGPVVKQFENNLAKYLNVKHVIACGNGTDALQIAMMSINLEPGDEVIVPSFTYVATAEVIALLGLKPVMVDVDPVSFNMTATYIEDAISSRTKAIVPVHLYGQSCDMDHIMKIAEKHGLYVIEDNAQAIGSKYIHTDQSTSMTGTIGHIGCTSFFPSKNLGCFGDGGAITTNDDELAKKIRMIANHGQRVKYQHDLVGCNSRLDAIQAAVLNVKLTYLDTYGKARQDAAAYYSERLKDISWIETPTESPCSTHVYHQYTIIINNGLRNDLQAFLKEVDIASTIYYPIPLYRQKAFKPNQIKKEGLQHTEMLCHSVLSLPIHTEMTPEIQDLIIDRIKNFPV